MAFGVVTFVTLPLLDRLFVPYFLKINPIEATPIEFTMVKVEDITGNNSNKPFQKVVRRSQSSSQSEKLGLFGCQAR